MYARGYKLYVRSYKAYARGCKVHVKSSLGIVVSKKVMVNSLYGSPRALHLRGGKKNRVEN